MPLWLFQTPGDCARNCSNFLPSLQTTRSLLRILSRQTLTYLLGKAELFGWDTSGTDAIFQTAEDATRAGTGYEFTFGPADATGVAFSATATCDTTGFCAVNYDVTPRVG